jgi:hypothetical protein
MSQMNKRSTRAERIRENMNRIAEQAANSCRDNPSAARLAWGYWLEICSHEELTGLFLHNVPVQKKVRDAISAAEGQESRELGEID